MCAKLMTRRARTRRGNISDRGVAERLRQPRPGARRLGAVPGGRQGLPPGVAGPADDRRGPRRARPSAARAQALRRSARGDARRARARSHVGRRAAAKGEALLRKGDSRAAFETLQGARCGARRPRHPSAGQRGGAGDAGAPAKQPERRPPVGRIRGEPERRRWRAGEPGGRGAQQARDRGWHARTSSAVSKPQPAAAAQRPVKSRTGTVEVDPEIEGVRLDDDDIGELSPPPSLRKSKAVDKPKSSVPRRDSGMKLDSDESHRRRRGDPAARQRAAGALGPLAGARRDRHRLGPARRQVRAGRARRPRRSRRRSPGTPHVMQVTPVTASPQVPAASARAQTMMPQQLISQQMQQQMMPQPPQPLRSRNRCSRCTRRCRQRTTRRRRHRRRSPTRRAMPLAAMPTMRSCRRHGDRARPRAVGAIDHRRRRPARGWRPRSGARRAGSERRRQRERQRHAHGAHADAGRPRGDAAPACAARAARRR